MFGSYLQGFIGLALMFFVAPALVWNGFTEYRGTGYYFAAFAAFFGGGFLRYLSQQTTRMASDLTKDSQENATQTAKRFLGEKILSNQDYRLFLVEKYSIQKNETLGVFSIRGKSAETLDEALNAAHQAELGSQDNSDLMGTAC